MQSFFNQFKTPIVIVAIIFIAMFLYTNLAGPIPFSINSVQTTKTDLFQSQGQGQVSQAPDQATIYLGITTNASTVGQAQDNANQTMNKIISAIKFQGISDKDIKTTNYSITPNYGDNNPQPLIIMPIRGGGNTISGYTVSQNLEVKVKPIDKVNKVIDTATANGANLVGGINFTFSDDLQKSLEQKARLEAVNDAKQKAQELASASGIRLGKIVNVVESGNGPIFMPLAAGMAKADSSTNQETTNVTPGQNTITVNVTIYYETY